VVAEAPAQTEEAPVAVETAPESAPEVAEAPKSEETPAA
jgi:hypothetical protein